MSKAVRYVLETFENVDKKLFEDFDFRYEISGFIQTLDVRQGDYKVVGFSEDGLIVEFLDRGDEKPRVIKFDKKAYTKAMMDLLKDALDGDYEIKTVKPEDYLLEKANKSKNNEQIELYEIMVENLPPLFEFYSKNNGFVGSLLINNFTLPSSCYPEAIYLMEKIGRALECKKGKLQYNPNPENFGGIKNMEEWKRDLLSWKKT